ncbi:MAG TPA: type I restriction enzyme HsdR N-terminal domain-containing protein [Pirellulales bacterium]|nr:type I restriction enzyme HsdR N-terminal domain-containing protein [Pirellulales bacterium]
MPAPPIIRELVEHFERNRESYLAAGYNETQIRREFLDPCFKALGWDIDNEQRLAEAYKDVVHEDAIKVGVATKAPDYCFRIGGRRIYFLEAKKPAVKIHDDPVPAFQLRRYAWSSKLPLSVLSNFESLAVYDCRIKPDKRDKASVARVMLLNYKEYDQRWNELAGIFSRDAVLKGSFDRYAESTKLKRGTGEVDEAFLKEIESWRGLFPVCAVPAKEGAKITENVVHRTSLTEQLESEKNPESKTRLQRDIDATDRRIDKLVYELYGLTEAEIAVVEDTAIA